MNVKKWLYGTLLCSLPFAGIAQHKVKLVTLWQKPQVHLVYRQYDLFFTIRDINATMKYLHDINPEAYDSTSHLDTNHLYSAELVEGRDMEYMNRLQPLLQNEVGAYLLYKGRVFVQDRKHRKIKTIIANAGPVENRGGISVVMIHFYDADNNKEIFAGMMNVELQHRYLELD